MDQLKEGLNTLDILTLLREYPVTMRCLFIANSNLLTADAIQDMFFIHFSASGSNERQKEEEITMFWITFLQDVQSNFAQF